MKEKGFSSILIVLGSMLVIGVAGGAYYNISSLIRSVDVNVS